MEKKIEQYMLNIKHDNNSKVEVCCTSSFEKFKSALKCLEEAVSLSDEEKAMDTIWPTFVKIYVERISYDGYYWYGDGINCFRTDDPEFKSKIEKFLANDEFVSAPSQESMI